MLSKKKGAFFIFLSVESFGSIAGKYSPLLCSPSLSTIGNIPLGCLLHHSQTPPPLPQLIQELLTPTCLLRSSLPSNVLMAGNLILPESASGEYVLRFSHAKPIPKSCLLKLLMAEKAWRVLRSGWRKVLPWGRWRFRAKVSCQGWVFPLAVTLVEKSCTIMPSWCLILGGGMWKGMPWGSPVDGLSTKCCLFSFPALDCCWWASRNLLWYQLFRKPRSAKALPSHGLWEDDLGPAEPEQLGWCPWIWGDPIVTQILSSVCLFVFVQEGASTHPDQWARWVPWASDPTEYLSDLALPHRITNLIFLKGLLAV